MLVAIKYYLLMDTIDRVLFAIDRVFFAGQHKVIFTEGHHRLFRVFFAGQYKSFLAGPFKVFFAELLVQW